MDIAPENADTVADDSCSTAIKVSLRGKVKTWGAMGAMTRSGGVRGAGFHVGEGGHVVDILCFSIVTFDYTDYTQVPLML